MISDRNSNPEIPSMGIRYIAAGDSTHHQDQAIQAISFNVTNIASSTNTIVPQPQPVLFVSDMFISNLGVS